MVKHNHAKHGGYGTSPPSSVTPSASMNPDDALSGYAGTEPQMIDNMYSFGSAAASVPRIVHPQQPVHVAVEADRKTVTDFVSDHLYPKVKFVGNKAADLAYNEDKRRICGYVLNGCNMMIHPGRMKWWNTAKKWVNAEIRRLRSASNTAIRNEYFGKYKCIQITMVQFDSKSVCHVQKQHI